MIKKIAAAMFMASISMPSVATCYTVPAFAAVPLQPT